MIETDAGLASSLNWGELAMSELPTGTVTLLLADVEGSTRLWETQPESMTEAIARLDQAIATAVGLHGGVRPVEQGEGDSFVIAFARASDAVACAVDLQLAPLAPIKLRIGVHTGEIQLRDESNYIGPTINRTARLRDLGHGGQTLISGITESLVVEHLPAEVTLTDLGTHPLRDLPRPERVAQVCHCELRVDFPPLRTAASVVARNVPTQLTTFVGRGRELADVAAMLCEHRLVTITGIGGAGKTRLAIELANELATEFEHGAWFVDLAPINTPELLETTVARSLGRPEEPGVRIMDTITRFVGDRRMLLIIDNCEHLVDSCAQLIDALLTASNGLTVLTTSREPVGVAGEVSWRMPSLSLADEAVDLFVERARRVRADFTLNDRNHGTVAEICRRLDGLPLAIELAAARVRALTLTEVADSLNDRFRLLTGGSRTAVRRQQTLRASVDWSHALLSQDERVLFRRLGVFAGGFDLAAALYVSGGTERYLVLDQLTLLVDKSLLIADHAGPDTRYRLLETMRQYAVEKLSESGEAAEIRGRHCEHYVAAAAQLDSPADAEFRRRLAAAEADIDNLRGAFGWCVENHDFEQALTLTSSLQPLWYSRSHRREGNAWFQWVLDRHVGSISPAVEARALADKVLLEMFSDAGAGYEHAQRALALARETDDRALLLRALTACSFVTGYEYESQAAMSLFAESIELARELGDQLRLCLILTRRAGIAVITGDSVLERAAAEEGRALAEAIGDDVMSRECQSYLGWAQVMQGEMAEAAQMFSQLLADPQAMNQIFLWPSALQGLSTAYSYLGDYEAAHSVAHQLISAAADDAEYFKGMGYAALSVANLVSGEAKAAAEASELACTLLVAHQMAVVQRGFVGGVAALVMGDLETATRYADESLAAASGWHLALAMIVRGRVSIASDDWSGAQRLLVDGLDGIADTHAYTWLPDALELLARVAVHGARWEPAATLFGAAQTVRRTTGMVRWVVDQSEYDAAIASVREALSADTFDAAWTEGVEMSAVEAIAYALRGWGERKRPATGWKSLTPAEVDVVNLVAEGLTNKDVGARLFISPRTVQAHLAHIFAKLGVSTRTQLAQEASRNV